MNKEHESDLTIPYVKVGDYYLPNIALSPDAAAAASARLQKSYGKHYNAQLVRESQQDVASWLGESTQPASIRAFLHRAEKKMYSTPKHSKDTPER